MKPRIILNCPANRYTKEDERIIEFTFPGTKGDVYQQGGLISFQIIDGVGYVDVYQCDSQIVVNGVRQTDQSRHVRRA